MCLWILYMILRPMEFSQVQSLSFLLLLPVSLQYLRLVPLLLLLPPPEFFWSRNFTQRALPFNAILQVYVKWWVSYIQQCNELHLNDYGEGEQLQKLGKTWLEMTLSTRNQDILTIGAYARIATPTSALTSKLLVKLNGTLHERVNYRKGRELVGWREKNRA